MIDRGGNVSGTGINTVTNYGDISSIDGPAIQFGRNSAGTIDNYGTVNSRIPNPSTDSARGILIDTTRSVTLNNHVGASIKSASGPSPNAVNILAGTHVVTNEGLIQAYLRGIQVSGGSAQITNRGTIASDTGTAISFESSGNTLTLDTGSSIHGTVASLAPDNHLRLQGSGSEGSQMTGFADLVMAGTAWTLSGDLGTTGQAANTIDVQTGTLTLTGVLTTGFGGGATIASGAGLTIGTGGVTGFFAGDVVDNGVLTLNRSNNLVFAFDISGTGSVVKRGAGTTVLDGANSYSGGTRIEAGVLAVWNDGDLGNVTGGLTFDGGTLRALAPLTSARAVTVEDGGGTIDTSNASVTLSGPLSGAYALVKIGSAPLYLTADSTGYTGTLTISSRGPCRSGRAEPRAPSPRHREQFRQPDIQPHDGSDFRRRCRGQRHDRQAGGQYADPGRQCQFDFGQRRSHRRPVGRPGGERLAPDQWRRAVQRRERGAAQRRQWRTVRPPRRQCRQQRRRRVQQLGRFDLSGPHRRIGHCRQAGRRNAHADLAT